MWRNGRPNATVDGTIFSMDSEVFRCFNKSKTQGAERMDDRLPPRRLLRSFGALQGVATPPFHLILPWAICRNVEDFCCINLRRFSRGFSWRIFLGTFSHKNEKKFGEKIREKIRRLKNKNPRKIHSAESRP